MTRVRPGAAVYKLMLCLRYLRTRYLAFICIGSVMLGVAILIVVNSVMSGFSSKLKTQLNGLMSEVTIQTESTTGFGPTTPEIEEGIKNLPMGKHVEAISPTVEVFAILQFEIQSRGQRIPITKHVKMIGIDPARHVKVGQFGDYLVNSKSDPANCFQLSADGKRRFDSLRDWEAWDRMRNQQLKGPDVAMPMPVARGKNGFGAEEPVIIPREDEKPLPANLRNIQPDLAGIQPVARMPGIVLGFAIAHQRMPNPKTGVMEDVPFLKPGDDVFVATIGASGSRPVSMNFVVTDYFKSEMSEYDGNFVYVPLEDLQRLRGMDDRVNSIQIRLTPDIRENQKRVHDDLIPELQSLMPIPESHVESWWQKQGPLFAAIDIERGLLNFLLFMIVGVAGFGVLAIFSMIVSEKYRDVGILKSLGASSNGVMAIFVCYGFLLGLVGCILGTALGLALTWNINGIEQFIARSTGREVFDRKIYYFNEIPTHLEVWTVVLVNVGAIAVAVISSIIPAYRAARLQPVRALRFE